MKKTITTKRGIEVDVEVWEYSNNLTTSTLKVVATVEEGDRDFELTFDNKTGLIGDDNINEFLDDADTTSIENWADGEVIGFLSGELNKWCISSDSNDDIYYSVSIYTKYLFIATITISSNNINFIQLHGEKEIRQFLNDNK